MSQEMETLDARLASFETVLPGRRRNSSAKSTKPISWPHSRPSPAELAHAGFYYEPHETNPDNTRCFLCESALDGWEEEDNPITEHLTLSQNCGWAIMKDIERHSSNPAEIEDPTSERISGARSATFGLYWPHDGKRGWVCQSEKMVAGGWYFCANEESNDLASCAYCKLSLDGWEPKDDPYEEHYRRSSDCSFFVFAQNPSKKAKASRSKKPRTSKATQSTASDAPPVDLDDQVDENIEFETTPKTKNTKKSSKSKAKPTKSKRTDTVNTDDQMDIDGAASEEPEPPKPKRATRGKKRTSEEVSQSYGDEVDIETTELPEPAPKRRATRTRNSTIQQNYSTLNDAAPAVTQEQNEMASQEAEPKKGRRTKKNASTKGRKVSEVSISKAPPTSRTPDDAELDAALEADLEADPASSEEKRAETTTEQTLKKPKSSKKSKPSPEAQGPADMPEHDERQDRSDEIPEEDPVEPVEIEPRTQVKTGKSSGKRKAKGSKSQEKDSKSRESPEIEREDAEAVAPTYHESLVSVEIETRKPQQSAEAEILSDEEVPKLNKKAYTGKSKKLKKPSESSVELPEPEEEDEGHVEDVQDQELARVDSPEQREATSEQEPEREQQPEELSARRQSSRRSSGIPPKTIERYSNIPQEKQLAKSLTDSHTSDTPAQPKNTRQFERQASGSISPFPSTPRESPSLSPQSSDAENQPPSTKPSASRNFALSPFKQPSERTPLTASTPSPSKQNVNTGGLKTSRPWTPIDIESILFVRDGDKDNASPGGKASGNLTSPEKKMTVEEWINWNAKNGEERLKQECERLVSQFEKEGGRAMRVLEGIECID
ncbi:uncharacterized protein EURHEDRAFT_374182 [Aspergillus ruber CBS 135680]|uniref:Chromosome segregation protein BIR1 n=1 Tax=Aspergillus ruber (strain CBS 135680) TaxID=1388766 RepID=A0A017SQ91_ASPRC|nr:uncharacterized protein EURHEDRAFT_374182 [Aspergillus ruber CBS 135680]EYE99107.1 hypothetical protein EURHEDRAFT_374182 [Aspergillus ruber CBS 135680]